MKIKKKKFYGANRKENRKIIPLKDLNQFMPTACNRS